MKVCCGSQFSVALTKDGQVYTWGKGDNQRLGHGTDEHVRYPKLLDSLQGEFKWLLKVLLYTRIQILIFTSWTPAEQSLKINYPKIYKFTDNSIFRSKYRSKGGEVVDGLDTHMIDRRH